MAVSCFRPYRAAASGGVKPPGGRASPSTARFAALQLIGGRRIIGATSYHDCFTDTADYTLYVLGPDGTVKSSNAEALRVDGYLAREIIGSNFSVLFTDDDRCSGEPARALERARSAPRFEVDGWRVRKDGTRVWARISISAVRDGANEITGFVRTTVDIHSASGPRAALAEQRELNRLILESARNGVLVVDRAGSITSANSRAEAIFGFPRGALLAQPVDRLIPEFAPAADESNADRRVVIGRRFDGSAVPVELVLDWMPTINGRVDVMSISDVGERLHAQEQLRATAAQLRERNRLLAMAEKMSHTGHWRLDVKSNEVYWSAEMYRTFGVPPSFAPTLENSMSAYHPDDREEARAVIRRAVSEEIPYTRESRAVRPDGSIRHVIASGQPEYGLDGTLIAFFGVFQDVTETKAAERERSRLLERVNLATQALHVGIWDWDMTTDTVIWDPIMFALYGVDDAQFVPTSDRWAASLHADDRVQAKLELARAATSGAQLQSEYRILWLSGEVRNMRVMATVVCDEAGVPKRMIGTNWDVTEGRMLAEELNATSARDRATAAKLTEVNHLMKMAEEIAHYGHWRIDIQSNDVYWSDEVCRIHGLPTSYKPTMQTGLAAYDPHGPDVAAIVGQALRDGKPFVYESRILRSDETYRDVRCLGRGEVSADGSLVTLVGIFQDITMRKDAERVRDRLTERVSQATKTGKVGIWEWAIDTPKMTWLTHMFALYGLDASSTVSSYELWKSALHPDDRERAERAFHDALAGRELFDTEFRIVWPNGVIRNMRSQAKVLRDAAEKPVRMIGITWDITQARSLANEMLEEQERLHAAERERLFEHERRWSRTFQRAVLPVSLPQVTGCTFDAVYEPGLRDAQVGSDWYDVVPLTDGRILVSIGDVSGNGLQAAVVVGVARQIIRGISQLHASPVLILDAADRALCLEYPGIYVSAWVGLIDLIASTINYASAGHPPPLLVSSEGAVRELDDATTMLIGLRKGHRGQASTVSLAQGDTLVLYTDGITEAGHDLIAGTKALIEAAAKFAPAATQPAECIKRQVIPNGSADDVALLVVRTDSRAAERYIDRWKFDAGDGHAAARIRGKFVESLRARQFTAAACANAELVFGELIGNVVRHATQTGDVEVAVDHGGLETVLHVLDHGGGFNHASRLPRDPYAENGRGLFLIAALTEDFHGHRTAGRRQSCARGARAKRRVKPCRFDAKSRQPGRCAVNAHAPAYAGDFQRVVRSRCRKQKLTLCLGGD